MLLVYFLKFLSGYIETKISIFVGTLLSIIRNVLKFISPNKN